MTIFLFFIFITVNLIDGYLTHKILKNGGKERNPVINKFGLWQVKGVMTIILIALIFLFPLYGIYALISLNLLGIGVCIWNYLQYKKVG